MRILSIAIALLAAAVLPGCGDKDATVTIVYDQDSNFATHDTEGINDGHHAPDGQVFVMYRIVSIANTGPKPIAFTFGRDHMTTIQDELSTDHAAFESVLLGPELIGTVHVAPGATESDHADLGCFIMAANVKDGAPAAGKMIDLLHQVADQPVHMQRMGGDTVATYTDGPSGTSLQNRCQGKMV